MVAAALPALLFIHHGDVQEGRAYGGGDAIRVEEP